jgi:DNA-binding FadR family transcriptional regulator
MQAARDVVTQALEQVVHVPRSPESAVVEDRAVLEAIQAKNPEWARNAMREHLERVERDAKKGSLHG